MNRLIGLLLTGLLTACATSVPRQHVADAVRPAGTTPEHLPGGAMSHVDADSAAVIAERGIGGTGAPNKDLIADRGIGGTGIVRRASNTSTPHGSAPIISLVNEAAPSAASTPPSAPANALPNDGTVVVTSAPASSAKPVVGKKPADGSGGKTVPHTAGQPTAH